MPCLSAGKPLWVVMGARTRLGGAIVATLRAAQLVPVLTARHGDDVLALAQQYPNTPIFGPTLKEPLPAAGSGGVRLLVCAFGPVHPAHPSWEDDATAFATDVALARQVLRAGNGPTHAVLVSTVLALAPTRDRCHYGGFKNLAESQLASALAQQPAARMSVLYPGRLGDQAGMLGTSYTSLASLVCSQACESHAAGRVCGRDARLWLLRQVLRGALSGVTGRVDAPALDQRDGDPRS